MRCVRERAQTRRAEDFEIMYETFCPASEQRRHDHSSRLYQGVHCGAEIIGQQLNGINFAMFCSFVKGRLARIIPRIHVGAKLPYQNAEGVSVAAPRRTMQSTLADIVRSEDVRAKPLREQTDSIDVPTE